MGMAPDLAKTIVAAKAKPKGMPSLPGQRPLGMSAGSPLGSSMTARTGNRSLLG